MSTEVAVRPIFRAAEYLRELVRKNQKRAEDAGGIEPQDVPPFAPDGEAIECEALVEELPALSATGDSERAALAKTRAENDDAWGRFIEMLTARAKGAA
jgi:hypothetical protein